MEIFDIIVESLVMLPHDPGGLQCQCFLPLGPLIALLHLLLLVARGAGVLLLGHVGEQPLSTSSHTHASALQVWLQGSQCSVHSTACGDTQSCSHPIPPEPCSKDARSSRDKTRSVSLAWWGSSGAGSAGFFSNLVGKAPTLSLPSSRLARAACISQA